MKLYNTLSKKLEDFKPKQENKVTFYSCGPTVYDYPHIGNWYTFIRYDMIYRLLKAAGYDVYWVMNITDVGHLVSDADEGEDKLEKGAKREGSTAWDVAKKYTDYFIEGLDRLNINQPTQLPKATELINEQIELVKKLEDKGYTYKIDDGIYFDTSKFKDYGKLGGIDLEGQKAGARVENNPQKKQPYDFALWKFSPKGSKRDMEWDSPWGKGFPGWHIECSTIAMKFLGETIDIHAGGIDHISTHHNNEIAQSEAVTGKRFVNLWMHMNFILVDGKKMAKSAGSFYTLEDIEKKGYDVLAFRLMVLQSHYRTEAHFSWKNLEAAQNLLNNWRNWAVLRFQDNFLKSNPESSTINIETGKGVAAALGNDLNVPASLALVNHLVDITTEKGISKAEMEDALHSIDDLYGLDLMKQKDIGEEVKKLLAERQSARDKKDYKKSDELRRKLNDKKIDVKDTKQGQIWSRILK